MDPRQRRISIVRAKDGFSNQFRRDAVSVLNAFDDQIQENQPTDDEDIRYQIEVLLDDVEDPRIAQLLRQTERQNFRTFRRAYVYFNNGLLSLGFDPAPFLDDTDDETVDDEGDEKQEEQDFEGRGQTQSSIRITPLNTLEARMATDLSRRPGWNRLTTDQRMELVRSRIARLAQMDLANAPENVRTAQEGLRRRLVRAQQQQQQQQSDRTVSDASSVSLEGGMRRERSISTERLPYKPRGLNTLIGYVRDDIAQYAPRMLTSDLKRILMRQIDDPTGGPYGPEAIDIIKKTFEGEVPKYVLELWLKMEQIIQEKYPLGFDEERFDDPFDPADTRRNSPSSEIEGSGFLTEMSNRLLNQLGVAGDVAEKILPGASKVLQGLDMVNQIRQATGQVLGNTLEQFGPGATKIPQVKSLLGFFGAGSGSSGNKQKGEALLDLAHTMRNEAKMAHAVRGGRDAPEQKKNPQIQKDINFVVSTLHRFPPDHDVTIQTRGSPFLRPIIQVILDTGNVKSISVNNILNDLLEVTTFSDVGDIENAFSRKLVEEGLVKDQPQQVGIA